jgi:hypothetical protein
MLEPLLPVGLVATSKALGINSFDVVRIAVLADKVPADAWLFDEDDLAALREFGGIEDDWWEGAAIPDDEHPRRRLLRAMLARMIERDQVGDNPTRLDNLWRGRSDDEAVFLERACDHLASAGLLAIQPSPAGRVVALVASRLTDAETIARQARTPAALRTLLGSE